MSLTVVAPFLYQYQNITTAAVKTTVLSLVLTLTSLDNPKTSLHKTPHINIPYQSPQANQSRYQCNPIVP
jgi:hypothetical protein